MRYICMNLWPTSLYISPQFVATREVLSKFPSPGPYYSVQPPVTQLVTAMLLQPDQGSFVPGIHTPCAEGERP